MRNIEVKILNPEAVKTASDMCVCAARLTQRGHKIKNMDDFAAINAIYAQYFTEPFPARSCVEVARLPKDVLLECEAIAEL